MKTLSKRFVEHAAATFTHGTGQAPPRTKLPYARNETALHYEGGTLLGATTTRWARTHVGNLPVRVVRTVTARSGTLGTVASDATWGAVPTYSILASQKRVLDDLGLRENTQRVPGTRGYSIPDALTPTELIEIKDAAYVTWSKQLDIHSEYAGKTNRTAILYVGERTRVSARVRRNFDVKRRSDLGPQ